MREAISRRQAAQIRKPSGWKRAGTIFCNCRGCFGILLGNAVFVHIDLVVGEKTILDQDVFNSIKRLNSREDNVSSIHGRVLSATEVFKFQPLPQKNSQVSG